MILSIDSSLIDWSRGQFALTAMYHWMFVPLTLGLSFVIAIMETLYVRTGKQEWKTITKFWMTLFGINFAIGVATGIILEFEFGTNWSNYSWFVGDIFGAPLAIEGIMAFFLESTFIAIMFFGWNKVSPKFHLLSTWLVAIGSNLSAFWILVANAWMQHPVGMKFNPHTVRNEMVDFWDVALSPVAVNKFLHTVTSGYVLASVFVIGVSAWFLLKKKHMIYARKSILVAAVFGFVSALFLAFSGDGSAYEIAQKQPVKFAAIEGLYTGKHRAGLVAIGIPNTSKKYNDTLDDYIIKVELPGVLSFLGYRDINAFVPGIKDLVDGNKQYGILSVNEKIEKGKLAINALKNFNEATKKNDTLTANKSLEQLNENFKYFGYGYLNTPESVIPNIPLTFYSFRIMVVLGFFFILFFMIMGWFAYKDILTRKRFWLMLSIICIPLAYVASQCGWIVSEVGRQPWVIQDLMPTLAAVSRIDASMVQITFWIFAFTFTMLLMAEITIMLKQIKKGWNDEL